ncbi:hypothetical protein RIF29_40660 [Crotalaria pallida]|uniref:F-box domain-containing protein n=1 Tax=Crotalaria pallida TaxID=3830 RepID=A0AAN9E3K9_CROPI
MPQSNSPHAALPTLPIELIIEILARLPMKFLMQFKCVCKSWETLISRDPKFAKKHLSTMNTTHFISRFMSPSEVMLECEVQALPECEKRVKVVVYNTRDETFKIPDIQDISVADSWFLPHIYAESSISPCS